MEDRLTRIDNYERTICEIYESRNIKSLRGLDGAYELKGRNILTWYSDTVQKGMVNFGSTQFWELLDDLMYISDEIMYFLASMYLHKPFMNNPLVDLVPMGERIVYTNRQNLHAKRYCAFFDISIEKLYNYWDRLGDLLAIYFKSDFKKKEKVFFSNTTRLINKKIPDSKPIKWLTDFYENEYIQLNEKRIVAVHHTNSNTLFQKEHLKVGSNREGVENWLKERDALTGFVKNNIDLSLLGFENVMDAILDINDYLNLPEKPSK